MQKLVIVITYWVSRSETNQFWFNLLHTEFFEDWHFFFLWYLSRTWWSNCACLRIMAYYISNYLRIYFWPATGKSDWCNNLIEQRFFFFFKPSVIPLRNVLKLIIVKKRKKKLQMRQVINNKKVKNAQFFFFFLFEKAVSKKLLIRL